MLKLYESIPGTPVLSLRSGGSVALILGPIINPNNLYIEAWHVQDDKTQEQLVLLSSDIREILPQGFAINDHEVLASRGDLIRLKDLIELQFDLHGLKVETSSGVKHGKVNDYAFETTNFYIQKIYASQSLVKNFGTGSLSVDRSQIVEITDKRLVINDPTVQIRSNVASPSVAG